jgi:predicted transcriptional regulator
MAPRRRTKGDPFSVRFSKDTQFVIEEEAKRLKRSRSSIVEQLAEEASRTWRFPGIGFRGSTSARRPWVVGTGLDVWELCEILDDLGSAEAVVDAYESVEPWHCRIAEAYRRTYPDEIAQAIAENQRPLDEWETLAPYAGTSSPRG